MGQKPDAPSVTPCTPRASTPTLALRQPSTRVGLLFCVSDPRGAYYSLCTIQCRNASDLCTMSTIKMYVIDSGESIKILDKIPFSRFSHVKSEFSLHLWLFSFPIQPR